MTFIVIDGPDGAGTTTQARLLAERLEREGHPTLLTAEPSDGPVGKRIRELLSKGGIDPMELQLLFTEDRAEHVKSVIEPALAAGKVVVCDRYLSSTIVYAQAQDLETDMLENLNGRYIQPDCEIYTLPPLAACMTRLGKRSEKEVFESEAFQKRVHEAYWERSRQNDNIRVVDTSQEKTASAEEIWQIVQPLL